MPDLPTGTITFLFTAIEHPWERILELPYEAGVSLPAEKRTIDVFYEVGRTLLILGEPGSGKTITLLELANDLIANLGSEVHQPIPVVFNLSAWTNRRQVLSDWLAKEMSSKYFIPEKLGRVWLELHRILPLLDGLGEVKAELQVDCVHAINAFMEQYGASGIVFCSRQAEYAALPVRLRLSGAIFLQPLTLDQIDAYFEKAGPQLSSLRSRIRSDKNMQVLAQSPLLLNIMSLAYQDLPSISTEKLDTLEAYRKHLFQTYVERVFTRKGAKDQPYSQNQTGANLYQRSLGPTGGAQTPGPGSAPPFVRGSARDYQEPILGPHTDYLIESERSLAPV